MTDETNFEKMYLNTIEKRFDLVDKRFDNIGSNLESINKTLIQLHVVSERNTKIVDQHQVRSLNIEKIVLPMVETLKTITADLKEVELEVHSVKAHVDVVNKWIFFFKKIPNSVQLFIGVFTLLSMSYGVIVFVQDIIAKANK